MSGWFNAFARWASRATGHPGAFLFAITVILMWAITGPIFGFSDTWQLVINMGTTIVTFLMVFLIQNTQNRDAAAMHLKLDEVIRSLEGAQNRLLDLEDQAEEDLDALKAGYERLARADRAKHNGGAS